MWDSWQFPKYNFAQLDLMPYVKYQEIIIIQTIFRSETLSETYTDIPIKWQSNVQLHRILLSLSSLVSKKGHSRMKSPGWKSKINDNPPRLLENAERRLSFYVKIVITLASAQQIYFAPKDN